MQTPSGSKPCPVSPILTLRDLPSFRDFLSFRDATAEARVQGPDSEIIAGKAGPIKIKLTYTACSNFPLPNKFAFLLPRGPLNLFDLSLVFQIMISQRAFRPVRAKRCLQASFATVSTITPYEQTISNLLIDEKTRVIYQGFTGKAVRLCSPMRRKCCMIII
jgi:hypothetical protein